MIGSLTFLPATLAIVGDRVNLGRPATWIRACRRLPVGPASRPGRAALDWLERRGRPPRGQRASGRGSSTGDGAAGADAPSSRRVLLVVPPSRSSTCASGSTDITGLPVIDRRHRRDHASSTTKCPFGQDLRLDVVVTNPTGPDVAGGDRPSSRRDALQVHGRRGPPTERASAGRPRGAGLVPDERRPQRRGEPGRSSGRFARPLRPEIFGAPDAAASTCTSAARPRGRSTSSAIYIDAHAPDLRVRARACRSC